MRGVGGEGVEGGQRGGFGRTTHHVGDGALARVLHVLHGRRAQQVGNALQLDGGGGVSELVRGVGG